MSIANSRKNKKENETIIIKKYANRRLYNMQDSMYITLADVRQLVIDNVLFIVLDAKDNNDLTRSVLLQIIMEAEQEGNPLFSSKVLSQLIRTYSNSMQSITNNYLEHHMQSLQNMHEDWLSQAKNMYGKKFSQDTWLEWLNQNQQNFLEVSLNWQNQVLEQIQQQNPLLNFLNAFQPNNK
jgi:polyhydroxyalkanoate synthesis repressor PhaR